MDLNNRIEKIMIFYVSPIKIHDEIGVNRPNVSNIPQERNNPSLDLILSKK